MPSPLLAFWGWKEKLPNDLWNDYKTLFHSILPRVCKDYDPKRLYWPSSPGHKIEPPKEGQLYGSGDNHYWGVWHGGDDFEAFNKNVGRLMSEYGMQSYPELSTIKSFYKSKSMNIKSKVMLIKLSKIIFFILLYLSPLQYNL